jgi:hypothetical protein
VITLPAERGRVRSGEDWVMAQCTAVFERGLPCCGWLVRAVCLFVIAALASLL